MSALDRFSDRAASYRGGRPSYPEAAIDALFAGLGDPAALTVVDLGAGTGISSRLLAARGARVIAVEPNAPMRAAAQDDPRVTFVDATAEATGLGPASADLVTAFQAFHWFDAAAAVREMQRLLRPGGRAAVIYNERDESDPATRAYGELVRRFAIGDVEAQRASAPIAFRDAVGWRDTRASAFLNSDDLTRERLIARVDSTSYLPHDGPQAEALQAAVSAYFDRYAVDGAVRMCMETLVTIAER